MAEPGPAEWRRIKDLLGQALSLPPGERPAFLERVSAGEPELHRELVELLGASAQGDDLLEPVAAVTLDSRVGPYRIAGLLGQGGMGSVYRAWDERLERWVALKTLAPDLASSREATLRFEREMKTLAGLDHPNVLKIFDVGELGGRPFAVTELLEGEDLASVIARGPLVIRRAIELAVQIAHGLAAAHAAAVIHRDLKPQNLFLTHDGVVKVLDFGIARQVAGQADPTLPALTLHEMPLGTPSYMAPEQARGERCDERSDLFAFGAIFYELLTGERAFAGTSLAEIWRRVTSEDPPELLARRPAVGVPVARIVERCLEKSPARRFQSAQDLAFHLEALKDDASRASGGWPRWRWPGWAAGASGIGVPIRGVLPVALVSMVIGALLTALGFDWMQTEPPEPPRLEFLTYASSDSAPAVSPDGKWLAYVSDRDGVSRIWLHQLATGEERWLAEGGGEPVFDPAGNQVLFTRDEPEGPALYGIGLLGGEPRRLLGGASLGAFAPDGGQLAFVRAERGASGNFWELWVAAVDGSSERQIARADAPISHLVWSSEGRRIWWVVAVSARGGHDQLWSVEPGARAGEPVEHHGFSGRLSRPAFDATGERFFVAQVESLTGYSPASRILEIEPARGRTTTRFWVPASVRTLAPLAPPAGDGLVLDAVTLAQPLRELLIGKTDGGAHWLTHGQSVDRQPTYAPDGSWMLFSSNRGGDADLWRWTRDTGRLRRLAPHPTADWDPAIAPDGRWIAWSSERAGKLEIYVADADGQNPRSLTPGRGPAENPSFTPDGAWVVYSSSHSELGGLRKVRTDGTGDVTITTQGGRAHPEASPDGRFVVLHDHLIKGVVNVRVVSIDSGEPTRFAVKIEVDRAFSISGVVLGRARWRPDGEAIAFLGLDAEGRVAILEQRFDPERDTSASRHPLVVLEPGQIPESFAYDPAEPRLAVSLVDRTSRILAARFSPDSRD